MEIEKTPTHQKMIEIGEKFFKWRSYTPIPLLFIVLWMARPTPLSTLLGTVLVIFGELFRIYSVCFIGSISRTTKNQTGKSLVTEGPFAVIRNPLYLANAILCLGIAVFSGVSWVVLLTMMLFIIQYYPIVKYEENLLKDRFGKEYLEYMQRVPAWLPRQLPRFEGAFTYEGLKKAILSEKRTLLSLVIILFLLSIIY